MEDSLAVALAKSGDGDAYRTLVERYSRSVFRLAYRMTGNEQDAEYVVQETFLRAFRHLHRWDARSSFGTWIYRIAANGSLDLLRSRKRRSAGATSTSETDLRDPMLLIPSDDPGPDRLLQLTGVSAPQSISLLESLVPATNLPSERKLTDHAIHRPTLPLTGLLPRNSPETDVKLSSG